MRKAVLCHDSQFFLIVEEQSSSEFEVSFFNFTRNGMNAITGISPLLSQVVVQTQAVLDKTFLFSGNFFAIGGLLYRVMVNDQGKYWLQEKVKFSNGCRLSLPNSG